jgi:hypothetical protein
VQPRSASTHIWRSKSRALSSQPCNLKRPSKTCSRRAPLASSLEGNVGYGVRSAAVAPEPRHQLFSRAARRRARSCGRTRVECLSRKRAGLPALMIRLAVARSRPSRATSAMSSGPAPARQRAVLRPGVALAGTAGEDRRGDARFAAVGSGTPRVALAAAISAFPAIAWRSLATWSARHAAPSTLTRHKWCERALIAWSPMPG